VGSKKKYGDDPPIRKRDFGKEKVLEAERGVERKGIPGKPQGFMTNNMNGLNPKARRKSFRRKKER